MAYRFKNREENGDFTGILTIPKETGIGQIIEEVKHLPEYKILKNKLESKEITREQFIGEVFDLSQKI